MRVLLCFVVSFLFLNLGHTQSTKYDTRLLEVYDVDFLERLENQSAQVLDLLTFELDNSHQIYNTVEDKKLVYDGELNITPEEPINILKLLKDEVVNQTQFIKKYYKLKDYDKVLVVFSKNEIVKNYNKKQR